MNGEAVFYAGLDGFVFANIGEAHVFAIPFQHLVQSLQTYCQYTHYNHFVEGASL